nr:hypothetical protein [uncultured Bacillus sp.]
MKKLIAALFSAVLILSPVGNVLISDESTTAVAKSYKSGKKSFNTGQNRSDSTINFQKKDHTTNSKVQKSTKHKSGGFFSGGLMKGLMLGGLAGLLFGSLFANMGILGSILGLMVNVVGIIILIAIIQRIFSFFKSKKKKEATHPWRN